MFPNLKVDATKVYLFIEFTASTFFAMMFVTMSLYEATVAGLTPVQLVLVGTTVEVSIFLFEVPTGVVADAYSRRTSIIIGYFLMGFGFLVEGLFPAFLPIVLAQIFWGLGYTFTSGATQAWISDEIGEEPANKLLLRANRVSLYASLLGMGLAILIGSQYVGSAHSGRRRWRGPDRIRADGHHARNWVSSHTQGRPQQLAAHGTHFQGRDQSRACSSAVDDYSRRRLVVWLIQRGL